MDLCFSKFKEDEEKNWRKNVRLSYDYNKCPEETSPKYKEENKKQKQQG